MELPFDLKFKTKWQKALLYSFVYYLMVLIPLGIVIIYKSRRFNIKLVALISVLYLTMLILFFKMLYKKFDINFNNNN